MTTSTLTVTDFVLARLAEDEAVALEAMEYGEGRWEWRDPLGHPALPNNGRIKSALMDGEGRVLIPAYGGDRWPSRSVAHLTSTFDPARVLAQCAAMRKIVEDCLAGRKSDMIFGQSIGLERAVKNLASIWSDHPQFNPDWS